MRGVALTRREALRLGAVGAFALSTPSLLRPGAAFAADPEVATSWSTVGDLVTREPYWDDDREQVLWTTVMRVDDKLTAPEDRWYLWHSTHDTPILRRYTAPSITGPWTERPLCTLPPVPSPWFNSHRQDPDIVWDPVGRRFLASLHSMTHTPREHQNTFMMQSRDGITWTMVTGTQAVPVGWKTDFDGYAIDYGRFLRDPQGNLVKHNGEYVWYYRGTRRIEQIGGTRVEAYQLGAITSPDLVNWKKVPGPLLDPGSQRLFGLGSALLLNGVVNLVWTVGVAGGTPQVHLQKSAPGEPFRFPQQGPGAIIYAEAGDGVVVDGPSLAIDDDGRQVMTFAAAKSLWVPGTPKTQPNHYAVRLLRSN